ncbi:hypothetical protein CCC_02937 [Paramagnetospirillum magnetotacticum MS-1]|uniref:Uncharacterized protein n=1 Tax=Paramagnetospirillum magnetotacticum MS-1 TaxID=272627 RepID=A0A0C2YYJ5_PARME|nr:hypothetical protein [Paramagnetospirillum magnetotacticum]KIM00149.1 hypothetical protein CCC_02937 [Paramagnetospirillum magnetotacticum MS-1]
MILTVDLNDPDLLPVEKLVLEELARRQEARRQRRTQTQTEDEARAVA